MPDQTSILAVTGYHLPIISSANNDVTDASSLQRKRRRRRRSEAREVEILRKRKYQTRAFRKYFPRAKR